MKASTHKNRNPYFTLKSGPTHLRVDLQEDPLSDKIKIKSYPFNNTARTWQLEDAHRIVMSTGIPFSNTRKHVSLEQHSKILEDLLTRKIGIVAHGFNGNSKRVYLRSLVDELHQQGYAVFNLDYRHFCQAERIWKSSVKQMGKWFRKKQQVKRCNFSNLYGYAKATESVPDIARFVAHLIRILRNMDPTIHVHMIGFSLGAQVLGAAGYISKAAYGHTIDRITGLDPAGPRFYMPGQDPGVYLDKSDAQFVDVIHTNPGCLGTDKGVGDIDFWPAFGKRSQKSCGGFVLGEAIDMCSHVRSILYFSNSIRRCANDGMFRMGFHLNNGAVHRGHYTMDETSMFVVQPLCFGPARKIR